MEATEPVTIVAAPRDRFSTIEKSLDTLFENTPEPFDLIIIMGGAPERLQKKLENKYGTKSRLIFKPEFLNGAQMRNMALPLIKTRLVVFVDLDVLVRPNWLSPLIQCQVETGASLIGPIVLERQDFIHAAGGDFYVTREKDRKFGSMERKFAYQFVCEETNIRRQELDFAEIHCQLMVVEEARKLGCYDEVLREHHEMDAGLTWKKAGQKQMLEPRSMVYFLLPDIITEVEDIKFYLWKWDIKAIQDSIHHFHKKWGVDLNGRNILISYFKRINGKVGFFSRLWPTRFSVSLDWALFRLRAGLKKRLGKLIDILTFEF